MECRTEESIILMFGLLCLGTSLQTTINIPSTAEATNGMKEYILYTQPQSWNTAKRVCVGIGGQLVKIDSPDVLNKLQTEAEAEGSWSSSWNHAWTGLHRAQDESLIYPDCTSFNFETLGTGMFNSPAETEYKSDKLCMRVHNNKFHLERHDCGTKNIFICERNSGGCNYDSVNTRAALVSQINATSGSCQSVCDAISGCYLAGNYLNSHCVLLKSSAGENLMSSKICYSALTNTTNTDSYKDSDDDSKSPTTCAEPTANSSSVHATESPVSFPPITEVQCPTRSSEVICPTAVVTLTPSVNDVTVVVTSAITNTVTEWLTETQILSLTEISTAILTSAETLTTTLTTMSVVNTCTVSLTPESSCVTEITSTNVFTTMADCPTVTPEYLTLTSSCQEQSVMISPTTVTFYESTSYFCEMASSGFGVISPVSASQMPTSIEPAPTETTICKTYNTTEVAVEALNAIVSSILRELTVETKNLSSTKRKKTSAKDPRVSSMGIGYGILAFAVVPFSLIILADLFGIFKDCRKYLSNIKRIGFP